MNNPEKLADTIVHLAHENARLSMEISILKTEINILNDKLDTYRETFLDSVLPPSKTNPDDYEWGEINIGDEFEDYEPYEYPDDDEWGEDDDEWYCKVCGGEFPEENRPCDLPAPESCKGIKPVCYLVDPPSGWKYGFPKIYKCWPKEERPPANLDWWLEKNGYPEHEIRLWQNSPNWDGSVPCRVWKHES
jgi:hypothetical protein